MLQNARFTAFTVSEFLRENQETKGVGDVKVTPPLPRLGLTLLKYDSIVRLLRDVFGHGRVP